MQAPARDPPCCNQQPQLHAGCARRLTHRLQLLLPPHLLPAAGAVPVGRRRCGSGSGEGAVDQSNLLLRGPSRALGHPLSDAWGGEGVAAAGRRGRWPRGVALPLAQREGPLLGSRCCCGRGPDAAGRAGGCFRRTGARSGAPCPACCHSAGSPGPTAAPAAPLAGRRAAAQPWPPPLDGAAVGGRCGQTTNQDRRGQE
jgi:hypothetical protein